MLGERLDKILDAVLRAHEAGRLGRQRSDAVCRLDLARVAEEHEANATTRDGWRLVAEEYLARLAERGSRSRLLDLVLTLVTRWLRRLNPELGVRQSRRPQGRPARSWLDGEHAAPASRRTARARSVSLAPLPCTTGAWRRAAAAAAPVRRDGAAGPR